MARAVIRRFRAWLLRVNVASCAICWNGHRCSKHAAK